MFLVLIFSLKTMEGFVEVNQISDFISYLQSIEWRDPWLIALLSFHIIVTFTCFSTRNYGNFQVVLFMILLLLVYFSENINEVAARNWALFSRQQYFDSKGLFISVVFSIPILLNCMIMVIFHATLRFLINVITSMIISVYKKINHRFIINVYSGSWLYQSTQLMTNLKKAQLRQRFKEMNMHKEHQQHLKAD